MEQSSKRIVLFVEGETERGDAQRKTVSDFLKRWLDPQLQVGRRVGIVPIGFGGIDRYLDDVGQKVEQFIDGRRANVVVGLVDLYGFSKRHDLSGCSSVEEKVAEARRRVIARIRPRLRAYFRQHFAVHEIEAWLLADPHIWPKEVQQRIPKIPPEQVNLNQPPSRLLRQIHGGTYKKTVVAKRLFPRLDPQTAMDRCPYLRALARDLLAIAQCL